MPWAQRISVSMPLLGVGAGLAVLPLLSEGIAQSANFAQGAFVTIGALAIGAFAANRVIPPTVGIAASLCGLTLLSGVLAFMVDAAEPWREFLATRFLLPRSVTRALLLMPALPALAMLGALLMSAARPRTRSATFARLRWVALGAASGWFLGASSVALWCAALLFFIAAWVSLLTPDGQNADTDRESRVNNGPSRVAWWPIALLALGLSPLALEPQRIETTPSPGWRPDVGERMDCLAADGAWTREIAAPNADVVILASGGGAFASLHESQRNLRRALSRLAPGGRLILEEPFQPTVAAAALASMSPQAPATPRRPTALAPSRRLWLADENGARAALLFAHDAAEWVALRPWPSGLRVQLAP